MNIKQIYKSIQEKRDIWDYYQRNIEAPNICDYKDCERFITEYIECSEKSSSILFENVKELGSKSPQRLCHIASTFFLGLWLFYNKRTIFIKKAIRNEFKKLSCFQFDTSDIERQFCYVWFMASLFHDLGYPAEDKEGGTEIPNHFIPFNDSVPDFYRYLYNAYYDYKKKKEHGIFAGLTFDKEMCEIRRSKDGTNNMGLSWREELEYLYHYVAWIILAHNIWMIREDNNKVKEYKEAGLDNLILYSRTNEENYKIKFDVHPLFTFFCIIDTIEPLKSTSCLSDVDIRLKSGKIIIKSNDKLYLRKVRELNQWLVPTIGYINEVDVLLL